MNVVLWILQATLALFCLSGGAYKVFAFDEMATQLSMLPRAAWSALGVLEMVCGVLLVIPWAVRWMPFLTPAAAGLLTLEALALAGVYASYSLKIAASNPLVWSVGIAVVAAVVAYGRYAVSPAA